MFNILGLPHPQKSQNVGKVESYMYSVAPLDTETQLIAPSQQIRLPNVSWLVFSLSKTGLHSWVSSQQCNENTTDLGHLDSFCWLSAGNSWSPNYCRQKQITGQQLTSAAQKAKQVLIPEHCHILVVVILENKFYISQKSDQLNSTYRSVQDEHMYGMSASLCEPSLKNMFVFLKTIPVAFCLLFIWSIYTIGLSPCFSWCWKCIGQYPTTALLYSRLCRLPASFTHQDNYTR